MAYHLVWPRLGIDAPSISKSDACVGAGAVLPESKGCALQDFVAPRFAIHSMLLNWINQVDILLCIDVD